MIEIEFPYSYRGHQEKTVELLSSYIGKKKQIVLESPTGSGKTITSLAATLPFIIDNKDMRLIYCVRTNSQQEQVIHELKQFEKKLAHKNLSVVGLSVQGRESFCPQQEDDVELKKSDWSEKSRMCSSLKSKTKSTEDLGCKFYRGLLEEESTLVEHWKSKIITAHDFSKEVSNSGVCPYELNKLLLKDADVVIVPYSYLFHEYNRKNLFEWMKLDKVANPLENVIVVIDEAHNLPDWARINASELLSLRSVELAKKEAGKYNRNCLPFLDNVGKVISLLSKKYIPKGEEEYNLPSDIAYSDLERDTFESLMMSHEFSNTTLVGLRNQCKDLSITGELIRKQHLSNGKRPRSYLGSVADFLESWLLPPEDHTIRLVGKNPVRIEKVCLDPKVLTGFLNSTAGVICMSGTLKPLDMFGELIGLKSVKLIGVESTFPSKNKKIVYFNDINLSYKNQEKYYYKLVDRIDSILGKVKKNTALFFTSYNNLNDYLRDINLKGKKRFEEKQGMHQDELMYTVKSFKSETEDALLAGVMGGRFAEGIDYPDTSLELAIIVGIPYPKPGARQKALERYYEGKFQTRGWEIAFQAPAVRKLLQAAGRVIRSEKDRGFIVIADSRVSQFQQYIPELEQSDDIVSEINDFFEA